MSQPCIDSLQIGMEWFDEVPGGLNRYYADLLRHLRQAGVRSHGLVAGSHNVARLTHGNVRAFAPLKAPYHVRAMAARRAVAGVIEERPTSMVAAHFAAYAFPVLDRLRRRPFVVHFHGPWTRESHLEGESRLACLVKALMERQVYRAADRCVVLSEAFGRLLHETFGVAEEHIRMIPAGVDVERFDCALSRSEARQRLGWPADRLLLVAVRRLVRRVGLENLLQAVDLVRRRIPEVLLLVAGCGPLGASLESIVDVLGLGSNVRLLGRLPDGHLPLAYRAADLSVVPSTGLEGFGLVALESLAAGTPVLVTPEGGLPEAVRDLCTNLVMPGCGSVQIAAAIEEALTGKLRLPSEQACRDFVRSRNSWPRVAARIASVYREVCA